MVGALVLAEVARAAREIFEHKVSKDEPSSLMFSTFPAGTCGPVTELLARYLNETFSTDALYANGIGTWRGQRPWSHAWVEVEGMVLDITADQFGQEPIIVLPLDIARWHRVTWERQEAPRPPITTHQQWPMYPGSAWALLRRGMEARGFGVTPPPKGGNTTART